MKTKMAVKYNIIQWNCRGFSANLESLQLLCKDFNPMVLALQELKSTKEDKIKLKGYKSYVKLPGGENPKGGVALLVASEHPQEKIPLATGLQAVAARVTINTPVTLCSLYLPPDERVSQNDLTVIINQLPTPFVLMGDFNAHNAIWGDSKTDGKGRMVERIIDRKSLCLFNRKEATYHHPASGSFSSIDLTMSDASIFADFEWRVHHDLCGSDHYPIILQTHQKASDTDRPPRWNISKADWE